MINLIKMYLITLVVFFTIDIIWLGKVAKNIYQNEIGFIMADKVNWLAAIIFYLIFIFGLIFFVINPAIQKDSWLAACLMGMLFGFISYATYDLTNLATLANWPLKITIIDLLWGTTLGGLVSTISFYLIKLFS